MQFPWVGWKDIFRRVFSEIGRDRVMLVAAGITFYLILALFPALAAFVSLYGLVADPTTITEQLAYLEGVLPQAGLDLVQGQLEELATQDGQALGFGFLISFAIAFWSAHNGVKALFQGMNVAYNEQEKRGFLKLTSISFVCTIGVMGLAVALIAVVALIPAVLAFVDLGGFDDILIRMGRWVLMLAIVFAAISMLYRIGPSRASSQWQWVTIGGLVATAVWIIASTGFSFYLQNFADYNATYGSLGAAIGFMMWIWISVVIVLVGAELNSEMEHQTAEDTTTGKWQPMGSRGAQVADDLGRNTD